MATEPAQLQIADPRNAGRHLRLSWHASKQVVVFSQWRDGVCVATTPVELAEIPAVIGALVSALEDAAKNPSTGAAAAAAAPTPQSVRQDIGELVRNWLRPRLAPITALTPGPNQPPEEIDPPTADPPTAEADQTLKLTKP